MGVAMARLPPDERPRERLLALGVDALSARELLACVIRDGRRGANALDIATSLLADAGGLAELARWRPEELARHAGVGPAKAVAIVAALRLGQLAATDEPPVVIRSAADVEAVARPRLAHQRREHVLVLVCDAANRLKHTEVVAVGAIDRAPMQVREILNVVLRHDGKAFAVAHNHPSGDPTPSDADNESASKLRCAARSVGLRFLGDAIVTAASSASGQTPMSVS